MDEQANIEANLPPRAILGASIGVTLAVLAVGCLSSVSRNPLVLGSFGSSCVLLFAFPDGPFSRPRSFVGGHFLSSFVGLAFLHFLGPQWWAMALACGAACALMALTRTLHPPAGSNPLIVYLLKSDWTFLWFPTLAGALVVLLVAVASRRFLDRLSARSSSMTAAPLPGSLPLTARKPAPGRLNRIPLARHPNRAS